MKKETDIEKLYTGDRIGLTAVEFAVMLISFGQTIVRHTLDGRFKSEDDINAFASNYTRAVFDANMAKTRNKRD